MKAVINNVWDDRNERVDRHVLSRQARAGYAVNPNSFSGTKIWPVSCDLQFENGPPLMIWTTPIEKPQRKIIPALGKLGIMLLPRKQSSAGSTVISSIPTARSLSGVRV
jgi:hypothetical protein